MNPPTPVQPPDTADQLRRALRAIKELRARAEAAESAAHTPIAIVGLALRFPGGADTPEKLWALLHDGVDAITEVPRERWDIDEYFDADPEAAGKMSVRHGGFVTGADQFDAGFFGVSPREAMHMDPQQRLLLQTTWEALEHAGIAPDSLAGTPAGIFVGISNQDYTQLLAARGLDTIDSYVGSGNAHSVAAGRLSYTLGLHGPSLALDTACSSSLVAVHLAVQSLRTGECRVALAGGVNLLLSPLISVNHSRARMLAPDGRCKTFDAAADGFIRSEGCGMVVLKRLADAQRDGDRVLAVIRGSAVNQDGRTSGLTVPSGPSQQAVIRAALQQAGIAPTDVDYVEAHGTGTALGDPIELGALGAVFGPGRPTDAPLRVGSIKTNLGHLESAAGVAGLIKVVLALQHDAIPPHLHFKQPNPLVAWSELPVEVPTRSIAWPAGTRRRVAGVSSFGFGGTNAHLVVTEPPPTVAINAPTIDRGGETLVLSARNDAALRALAGRYSEFLAATSELWGAVCQTAAVGRAQFKHRLAVSSETSASASALLARFSRGESVAEISSGVVAEPPRVAFLFSGQGSLYAGAGRELYASNAIYRAAVDECRAIVLAQAGWDVVAAFESEERLARTEFGQVALFVLEFALARVWQAWDVRPDAVAGHSVGEFAAACVAGVLTLESALTLLIARARLMGALPENGAMLAVSAGESEVAALLARDGVELGAVNSPRQVVLTGASAAIQAAADEAKRLGLRAQLLAVKQGYHSRQMEPMQAEFRRVAESVRFNAEPTSGQFVSTVTGRVTGAEVATADYWVNQIRQPVRFGEAMKTLHTEKIDLVIEIGPRGILVALGQQTWPTGAGEWLTSLRPGRGEWPQLIESVGRAWVRGAAVNWRAVYEGSGHRRVVLPTYPFQNRRHWFEERSAPTETAAVAPTYGIDWETQPLVAQAIAAAGSWCLVGDDGTLAAELIKRGQMLTVDPAAAKRGVVFFVNGAEDDLARLLAIVCAITVPAKIWIVTRQAVAVSVDDALRLVPDVSIAWGAGKVIALERAELGATRIDFGTDVKVTVLADELLGGSSEGEVALRADARRVSRLQVRALGAGAFRARPDATYLMTGGLGALGRRVAEWLAGCGARHLLLLGRNAPSVEAEAMLTRLRTKEVTVTVRAVDVADRAAMKAVVAECGTALPPLRGVFHVAGVAGFQTLESLDAAACAAVLRPKVAGARVLDELTAELSLDAFVLFSSIASVWGSKGQAHYAAANRFLDALAERRRALGRPALSVSWGPWAGGGMATPEAKALLTSSGVRMLTPAVALATLGRAMTGGHAHVAVAEIDWPVFRQVFELRGTRPLLERMEVAVAASENSAPAPIASTLADELRALDAAARESRLRAHVLTVLARVLKLSDGELPDPRQGFADQGVDSLMAVELKNRLAADLGVALPATLVFDYPDAERLTRTLLSRLQPVVTGTTLPVSPKVSASADPTLGARVAELSEAEVEALLLKKLETL